MGRCIELSASCGVQLFLASHMLKMKGMSSKTTNGASLAPFIQVCICAFHPKEKDGTKHATRSSSFGLALLLIIWQGVHTGPSADRYGDRSEPD